MVASRGCGLSLRVGAGPSVAVELGPTSVLLLCMGFMFVAPLLGFPSVPFPAAPAGFLGVSCRRFPLEVTLAFWL